MPVKLWQAIIRFCFFLSCLITTVSKYYSNDLRHRGLILVLYGLRVKTYQQAKILQNTILKTNAPYQDRAFRNKSHFTCIPVSLTPRLADVVLWVLAILRAFLAAETSSAYCLVPTLRSSMHGYLYLDTKFSSNR